MTTNSVLEQKLAQISKDNAEKDALLEALIAELRDKHEALCYYLKGADQETQKTFEKLGLTRIHHHIIKRSLGIMRSPLEIDEQVLLHFNGDNGLRMALKKPLPPPYSMKVRLKSTRTATDRFTFTDTSPPMPLVFGPVSLFLSDPETIRIFIGTGKEAETYEFWDDGGWVDIAVNVRTEGCSVHVDGRMVMTTKPLPSMNASFAHIGCGHLKRGWSGHIAAFAAVKGDWEVDNATLPDEGVILRYDGAKILQD